MSFEGGVLTKALSFARIKKKYAALSFYIRASNMLYYSKDPK